MSTAAEPQDVEQAAPAVELFYASIIDAAELGKAMAVEGVDQEIGLLRAQLSKHAQEHPDDVDLMLKSVQLIVRAVTARYRISAQSKEQLEGAMSTNVARLFHDLMAKETDDV